MSATPETDKAIIEADGAWTFALKDKMQSLERERDEARELVRELRDALLAIGGSEICADSAHACNHPEDAIDAVRRILKVKEVLG